MATSKTGGTQPNAFSVDRSIVLGERSTDGVLCQQIDFQYAQSISRVYTLGSSNVHLVAGHTHGEAAMSQMAAPKASVRSFYRGFAAVGKQGATVNCEPVQSEGQGLSEIEIRHALLGEVNGVVPAKGFTLVSATSVLFLRLATRSG